MKTTVFAILLVVCLVGIRSIDAARGIRVRFNISILFNINVFYVIPLTEAEAKKDGWVMIDTPDSPDMLKNFITYCYKKDKTVCVFFEPYTLQIAGLQIALCKDRFTPCHPDMEKQGFSLWTTDIDGVETECYVVRQFFLNSDFLLQSEDDIKANYNASKIIQGDTFSVTGMGEEITEFPIDVAEVEKNTLFKKQAYIPWMGTHYFYNMTESAGCSSEELKPWFLLTRDNQVIGCSMTTFGTMKLPFLARDWFENPTESAVKTIVPNGPQCLYDLSKQCGVVTSHVYWIENPQSL